MATARRIYWMLWSPRPVTKDGWLTQEPGYEILGPAMGIGKPRVVDFVPVHEWATDEEVLKALRDEGYEPTDWDDPDDDVVESWNGTWLHLIEGDEPEQDCGGCGLMTGHTAGCEYSGAP